MGQQGWSIVTGTGKPVKPSNHLFEVEAQKLSVEVAITREKPQLNLCKVGEKVPLLESEKHDRRVGAVCFVQAPTIAVTPQKICFGPKVSHPSTACTAFLDRKTKDSKDIFCTSRVKERRSKQLRRLPRMLRNACRCLIGRTPWQQRALAVSLRKASASAGPRPRSRSRRRGSSRLHSERSGKERSVSVHVAHREYRHLCHAQAP